MICKGQESRKITTSKKVGMFKKLKVGGPKGAPGSSTDKSKGSSSSIFSTQDGNLSCVVCIVLCVLPGDSIECIYDGSMVLRGRRERDFVRETAAVIVVQLSSLNLIGEHGCIHKQDSQ